MWVIFWQAICLGGRSFLDWFLIFHSFGCKKHMRIVLKDIYIRVLGVFVVSWSTLDSVAAFYTNWAGILLAHQWMIHVRVAPSFDNPASAFSHWLPYPVTIRFFRVSKSFTAFHWDNLLCHYPAFLLNHFKIWSGFAWFYSHRVPSQCFIWHAYYCDGEQYDRNDHYRETFWF